MKLKRRQVSKVAPGTFIEQLRSGSCKRATNRRRGDWKVAEGRGMEGSATLGGLGFCPQLYFNARRNAKRKKRTSSSLAGPMKGLDSKFVSATQTGCFDIPCHCFNLLGRQSDILQPCRRPRVFQIYSLYSEMCFPLLTWKFQFFQRETE